MTARWAADLGGGAVVHGGWGVEPDAGVAVFVVVVGEERLAERSGVLDRAEDPGNAGQYLRVLNPASEYGLSFETCGREWERATPRSTRS